jgi:hypothetical protein
MFYLNIQEPLVAAASILVTVPKIVATPREPPFWIFTSEHNLVLHMNGIPAFPIQYNIGPPLSGDS